MDQFREIDQLLDARPLPPLPADRLKQIEAAVITGLKPVRGLASPGLYFAALAGIFVAVCMAGCYVVGWNGWLALNELQKFAVFLPLTATAGLLAFSLVRQMSPASRHARSSAFVASAVFILLLLIVTMIFHPVQESEFVRNGVPCFRIGMAFAVPAAVLSALPLLRGAGLSPLLTGAAAGGLAGLAGLTVLEIQCPNLNVYHIVTWHVSVTVVCVFLGFIFSGVTFRRSASNP
jgi:hypothetical protein